MSGKKIAGQIQIVFDLDGTIVDSLQYLVDRWNEAIRVFNNDTVAANRPLPLITSEHIGSIAGITGATAFQQVFPGRPDGDFALFAPLLEAAKSNTPPQAGGVTLCDGMAATLKILHNKYGDLAIATGMTSLARLDTLLEHLGIAQYFPKNLRQTTDPSQNNPDKPDPTMLTKIAAASGRDRVMMVGDGVLDLKTAINYGALRTPPFAGVQFVAVGWDGGFQPAALQRAIEKHRDEHAKPGPSKPRLTIDTAPNPRGFLLYLAELFAAGACFGKPLPSYEAGQ